jgi:cation transporter-like permease
MLHPRRPEASAMLLWAPEVSLSYRVLSICPEKPQTLVNRINDCRMRAVSLFMLCINLKVMILLYAAHLLIHLMWKWKVDPDNSAIPLLTAFGDLLGSSLLALAFFCLATFDVPFNDCEAQGTT